MAIIAKRNLMLQNKLTDEKPMAELNITPLIDVLLVLLVMLMLSIPLATHKVELNVPPPVPGKSDTPPVVNNIRLNAAGTTYWNEVPMDSDRLERRLIQMARDPNKSLLRFEADATARYERFDQVVAMIKSAGVEGVGFADNKQYAVWDKAK